MWGTPMVSGLRVYQVTCLEVWKMLTIFFNLQEAAAITHPNDLNLTEDASKCQASLVQISSPSHIPLNDKRWQELWLHYNILVHLDRGSRVSDNFLSKICTSMTKHAPTSSNLAGMVWHVNSMMKEMIKSFESLGNNDSASVKISLVGKSRVVCGALNLLRIMIHEVIIHYANDTDGLRDVFTYTSRRVANQNEDVSRDLIEVLMTYIGLCVSKDIALEIYSTAEFYDSLVFSVNLLLVLSSTQLYQTFVSSFQMEDNVRFQCNYFLDMIMVEARQRQVDIKEGNVKPGEKNQYQWTSYSILEVLLKWMIERPPPPNRSIAGHAAEMAKMLATDVKGEKVDSDCLFENHAIVCASTPKQGVHEKSIVDRTNLTLSERQVLPHRTSSRVLIDATNKVLTVSTSLLLLPFRLMVLALKALGQSPHLLGGGSITVEDIKRKELQTSVEISSTNDVLWISDSPIADLGTALFLIYSNILRAVPSATSTEVVPSMINPFRVDLASLDDNRWESYSDRKNDGFLGEETDVFETIDLSLGGTDQQSTVHHHRNLTKSNLLTLNFEHMFEYFERTLHTEVGALSLYTLMHSSPIFATSITVRNDLDRLVLPLLRTLYFSTSISRHISGRTVINNNVSSVDVRQHPFRSTSHLYLIMILLLIFSQDASFGPVSFRRSNIPLVLWYKERQLKDISLGSLLISSLVRCITFNLNRMSDPFLLSNCCAVLLNLSPHIENIHSYAAMHLVSVLISSMKRYTFLVMKNGGIPASEEDVSSILGMYSESCRILLQAVKHAIRKKIVDKNLHLVYALVYHQRELTTVLNAKASPFQQVDVERIHNVIANANEIIQEASARTAEKSMEALTKNVDDLKRRMKRKVLNSNSSSSSVDSSFSDSTMTGMEDFKFTYEEESDPETFFVPYVWEVVVCTVTSGSLEWNRANIKAFQVMQHVMCDGQQDVDQQESSVAESNTTSYSQDVGDVV